MSASAPATKLQQGFNPLGYLIGKFSSNRGRRILFVTSLYFQIVRLDKLKEEAISKLNQLMHLSSSDSGLRLPVILHSFIWRKVPIEQILTEETIHRVVTEEAAKTISMRVAESAPKWVRYGSKQEMADDVFKLIMEGNVLS
jgi:hypothetical protein